MITKKVNRYYCEFCGKASCAAWAMRKHERACTLNPERICGMCAFAAIEQRPMTDIRACLPNRADYEPEPDVYGFIVYTDLEKAIAVSLEDLRKLTDGCPACIMAALRQQGIPIPAARDFDFKAECQQWFNERRPELVYGVDY